MKTFKILLLGGLIALISITSFSSAESITINGSDETYTPNTITIPQGEFLGVSNYSCSNKSVPCGITITNGDDVYCYEFDYFEGDLINGEYSCIAGETYQLEGYPSAFDTITLNFEDTNSGGGDDEGGDDIGVESGLVSIVSNLNTTISEFIPYVVYIGFGILGVVIGFFAIKRLLRYVKRSSLSVFSSRKRRK